MTRLSALAWLALAVAIAACGRSSGPPTAPDVLASESTAAREIEVAQHAVAASEVGAIGLAFDLEEGQRQAIAEAIGRARAALADLRARWLAGEIGAEATVAEARAIRATLDAEIDAALTPEQLAEIEVRRAAFRPGLDLTDEQRSAIRAIVDGWRVLVLETLRGLREDQLTPREAGRALAEGAREARAAVCGVLDSHQQTLFPHCAAVLPD